MSTRAEQIEELHRHYIRLTGYQISLAGREWCWFEWLKRDLTPDDLRDLVRDTRTKIARGELTNASLQFRNLIGQVDFAEEKIAELRARRRAPAGDPARASILRQTARPETGNLKPDASGLSSQVSGLRTSSDVVAKLTSDPTAAAKAFEELQKLKRNL